jgi:hypothetical protein
MFPSAYTTSPPTNAPADRMRKLTIDTPVAPALPTSPWFPGPNRSTRETM